MTAYLIKEFVFNRLSENTKSRKFSVDIKVGDWGLTWGVKNRSVWTNFTNINTPSFFEIIILYS